MRLLAIILNYKTADMTADAVRAALRELRRFGDGGWELLVVDNDSQDGSFESLSARCEEEDWGPRVRVVRSPKNGGFGFGNNVGLRDGLGREHPPEYFYILNSDAFVDEGAIEALVTYLDEHPWVGITGSYIHGPEGDPHVTAFRFPSLQSEIESTVRIGALTSVFQDAVVPLGQIDRTQKVDWLAGASMMIRADVLREVGLFDETFFLYFEETDLCRRAALAGWPTVYVRESSVTHIGSVSTGMKDQTRRRPQYWFDSRRHYFRKNHGSRYLWATNAAQIMGFGAFRVRQLLTGTESDDPPKYLRDFLKHTFSRNS
ncbi:MAG: glycosyltransferase family 2 protein [Myxococcota bacterium]